MISLLTDFFIWILTTSVMASVLILFIFLAKLLLKDKLKPRWSYLLWTLLVLRLMLPWTPESSFSVFNIFTLENESNHERNHIFEPIEPNTALTTPIQSKSALQIEGNSPVTKSVEKNPISFIQILSLVWLIGAVSMLGFIIVANIRFASKLTREPNIEDQAIRSIFEQCKDDMKVKRTIALIESNHVLSPTLFGAINPKLLLPRSVIHALNINQIRYVFLHELSHIKRNDIAMNWVMNVLLALHWFNPLLWYAYHKMRDDQEIACDSLALTRIDPKETKDYALTIIKLVESFSNSMRLAGAASISRNRNELKRRVIMIALFRNNSYKWSILGLMVLLLLSGCALTNAKSNVNSQTGNANANETVSAKPSAVNPDFPVPDDAVLTKGAVNNPKINKYAKYNWQEADEVSSISDRYLKEIEASGWKEKKTEQMGATRMFEKDGTVIWVTTHNGFFTLSELKKDNTSSDIPVHDGTSEIKMTIDGKEVTAKFESLAPFEPFGLYVPSVLERYDMEDGVEFGYDTRNLITIGPFSQFAVEEADLKKTYEALVPFAEYIGSQPEGGDNPAILTDFFAFEHEGTRYGIRFRS